MIITLTSHLVSEKKVKWKGASERAIKMIVA